MKIRLLVTALLLCTTLFAQQVPFSVEIEPVICGPMPGMHSFAFAQSGSKWLFVGGRTNGLHGFSTNNNFDVVYASDVITVIDTSTWSYYTSPLGQLPKAVADPLRATILARRLIRSHHPDAHWAHNLIGNIRVNADDLPGAVAEYRAALVIRSDFGIARSNLGDALRRSGEEIKFALRFHGRVFTANCAAKARL